MSAFRSYIYNQPARIHEGPVHGYSGYTHNRDTHLLLGLDLHPFTLDFWRSSSLLLPLHLCASEQPVMRIPLLVTRELENQDREDDLNKGQSKSLIVCFPLSLNRLLVLSLHAWMFLRAQLTPPRSPLYSSLSSSSACSSMSVSASSADLGLIPPNGSLHS